MSKVVIAGDASGTGTFTISAPNGNTDRTLVLPDEAGTVLTSAGVPASAMPAGSVIQMVTTGGISSASTTSTSFTSISGASLSITPQSASNKILVLWSSWGSNTLVGGVNVNYRHGLFRNSTFLYETLIGTDSGSGGLQAKGSMMFSVIDSPSSTSAVTYNIQHHTSTSSSTGYFNGGQLTLMEIAV